MLTIKKYGILICSIFMFSFLFQSSYAQNSNCNAQVKLLGKSKKNVGESGVYYRFKLENTSNLNAKYRVVVENSKDKNRSAVRGNRKVELNSEILNNNLKKINNSANESFIDKSELTSKSSNINENYININALTSKIFYVKFKAPKSAQFGTVNNSVIKVISDKCTEKPLLLTVQTTIIDGE
ncbi:MAG: hypothetical protein ACWA42_04295 [Lutibacter sp.]